MSNTVDFDTLHAAVRQIASKVAAINAARPVPTRDDCCTERSARFVSAGTQRIWRPRPEHEAAEHAVRHIIWGLRFEWHGFGHALHPSSLRGPASW